MSPQRVQRNRTKGWRTPPCSCGCGSPAIYVGRPTQWGNPYRPVRLPNGTWVARDDNGVEYPGWGDAPGGTWRYRDGAIYDCLRLFDEVEVGYGLVNLPTMRVVLGGHDLMCWCALDQPCHADVLLTLANQEARP